MSSWQLGPDRIAGRTFKICELIVEATLPKSREGLYRFSEDLNDERILAKIELLKLETGILDAGFANGSRKLLEVRI